MSGFQAAALLRMEAARHAALAAEASPEAVAAVKAALRIFDRAALEAVFSGRIAAVLTTTADVLERGARAAETPGPEPK